MATDDSSYQNYMQLLNKQQSIRRRLASQVSFTSSMMIAATPEDYSAVISPLGSRLDTASLISQPYIPSSRPIPTNPGFDHCTTMNGDYDGSDTQQTEDVKALYEINQQIKTTLTELLNSPTVKCNKKFRTWVQCRLMEAEREMKRERRRRSSSSVDPSTVNHIADSMEQFNFLRMTP